MHTHPTQGCGEWRRDARSGKGGHRHYPDLFFLRLRAATIGSMISFSSLYALRGCEEEGRRAG